MRLDRRTSTRAAILIMALVGVGMMLNSGGPRHATADPSYAYDAYRARTEITVGSVVRDFAPAALAGGHPDFVRAATEGAGRYAGIPRDTLDAQGKPVLASTGYRVLADWKDGSGRPIIRSKAYITALPGDTAGSLSPTPGGAVTTPAAFSQWFRDVPGVNTARRSEFTLTYVPPQQAYVFDGTLDSVFSGSPDYSYTYEIGMPFVHEAGKGEYIAAATNGDLWVYVDDRLVLDLGAGCGHLAALAVDDGIKMRNSASITGLGGLPISVSTNSTNAKNVELTNTARIAGDVMVGPGGNPSTVISASASAITGIRGTLAAPVPMPDIPVPEDLGPSVGDRVYSGGTHTINASMRVKSLYTKGNAVVNVSGDVRILVEEKCDLGNGSEINLMPGATLTIFVMKDFFLHNAATVNANTADPSRVLVVNLGSSTMQLDNAGQLFGRILSPRGSVDIGNNITVTGAILAKSVYLHNSAKLVGAGTVGEMLSGSGTPATQRIDLDRLGWLSEGRTHQLRIFFANRLGAPSRLRLETNMDLLNLAVVPLPQHHEVD